MTNNGVGKKIGNFGNVVYDSGNNFPNGRKRIGTSATEIEFLNDIPLAFGTEITNSGSSVSDRARVFDTQMSSSSTDKQKQQNNYQTLSLDREQPKSNVVYQDENDQQLNSAVNKLLDKYAPDATPYNVLNTTNSRQPPPQANVVIARDEPSFSTFQTTAPSSSTASHNYSTIIRPKTEQIPQTQTQINNNSQPSTRSRPKSTYDSFQHVIPPQPQQQQQQQQPSQSVSIKTKNGNFAQVVPGKLYTLNDDPLHLLYDRQNPVPPNPQQPSRQQPPFNTTFQPSSNFQTAPDPLTVVFTNTSQRYPQQPLPITTTTTDMNSNGIQPFDLAALIKRVQQDYLREIQPFVSSVKFVEKDREYGQSLADIGFITPVTVRKGFTKQADAILRRSFGRQDHQRKPVNRSDHNDYSDDDEIVELRSSNRHHPLEKFDSKQSFTSVTTVSSYGSDYSDQRLSLNNNKNKINVHDQATSPPAKLDQTKTQSQIQKVPAASTAVPSKPISKDETDEEEEEETTSPSHPVVPKLAKRISSDQLSLSSGSGTSEDQDTYSAKYNEHDNSEISPPKPSESVNVVVTSAPILKPIDETTRERVNARNQVAQRSEDVHPIPPTISASQTNPTSSTNSRTQVRKIESEASDAEVSGSDNVSESVDGDKSSAYINQPPASSTARSNVQQITSGTPTGRDSNTPQTNARVRAPPPTTTTQNPPSIARTTPDNNARQIAGSGTNPNIHFVPPDQRNITTDRAKPATSANQQASTVSAAPTGSTRLIASVGDPKPGSKRSVKEAPSTIGDKLKSLFRRK